MSNKDVNSVLIAELNSEQINQLGYVDCDADPFTPKEWTVKEHQKMGKIKFDPSEIILHLSKLQEKGNSITGEKMLKELKGKKVLNANVLDFLLKNPHLIPDEWKHVAIFFWGTIYINSHDIPFVRFLRWYNTEWRWGRGSFRLQFDADSPAACFKEVGTSDSN